MSTIDVLKKELEFKDSLLKQKESEIHYLKNENGILRSLTTTKGEYDDFEQSHNSNTEFINSK